MTQPAFSQSTHRHQEILEAQRRSWDKFSPGWEKWDDFTMSFLDAQGAAIVEALGVSQNSLVLDVASGTGEPGLTLAARAVAGSVTALDVSERMLAIADAKAEARGLGNFRTLVGDACQLPFADNSFDAVSCRLGFMFFPDMQAAAREMFRVLRKGGVLGTTVWAGPAENPWITALMGAIKQHFDVATPPPGAPGMFRCAEPGSLSALFRSVGLSVERDALLSGAMYCSTSEEYWRFMNDVVPPVVAVLKDADADTIAAIKDDLVTRLDRLAPTIEKRVACGAHVVIARK